MILIDFEGVIKGDAQQEGHTDWISFTKIIQKYTQFDAGGAQTQATDKGYDLKTGMPT